MASRKTAKKPAKPAKPEVGAIVLFRDYDTAGHTGRVVKVGRLNLTVRPTDPTGHRRIPLRAVEGWWPKGSRRRTPDGWCARHDCHPLVARGRSWLARPLARPGNCRPQATRLARPRHNRTDGPRGHRHGAGVRAPRPRHRHQRQQGDSALTKAKPTVQCLGKRTGGWGGKSLGRCRVMTSHQSGYCRPHRPGGQSA